MALRDDFVQMMRDDLGIGFETATFAALVKEVAKRHYAPKLRALYASRVNTSPLIATRQAAEQSARDAQAQLEAAKAAAQLQADTDLLGV